MSCGEDAFELFDENEFVGSCAGLSDGSCAILVQEYQKSNGRLVLEMDCQNLRPLAGVPSEKNAKGTALFALAALSNFRRLQTAEARTEAEKLIADLIEMKLDGYAGAAWGYNFDWQSRNFFAPKGTATVVPTAFAVRALIDAFLTLHTEEHLRLARDACKFVLNDLNRSIESADEICFSYSPLDRTQIFNASLFAGEILATVGQLTGENKLCELGQRSARFVVKHQRADGSWPYGNSPKQQWIDNFHTAYVLSSLLRIMASAPEASLEFEPALDRGFEFWRKAFFLADGWPKYYHDALYPVDAHAAATAIVTLIEFHERHPQSVGSLVGAERVAEWAIQNLRDPSGFFYYQRRRFHTVRTPFMRWTQSWMLYALARLLEAKNA